MNVVFENNEDCAVASEQAVCQFERQYRINLPADYRHFLLSSGGGSPVKCWSSFDQDGDYVAHVYGIHEGAEWKRLTNIVEEFQHDVSTFLPVAVSGGGNYFLLRLQEPDLGAIYFWDHELESFPPPSFESLSRVSDSFLAWLESLQRDPDEC